MLVSESISTCIKHISIICSFSIMCWDRAFSEDGVKAEWKLTNNCSVFCSGHKHKHRWVHNKQVEKVKEETQQWHQVNQSCPQHSSQWWDILNQLDTKQKAKRQKTKWQTRGLIDSPLFDGEVLLSSVMELNLRPHTEQPPTCCCCCDGHFVFPQNYGLPKTWAALATSYLCCSVLQPEPCDCWEVQGAIPPWPHALETFKYMSTQRGAVALVIYLQYQASTLGEVNFLNIISTNFYIKNVSKNKIMSRK